MGVTRRYLGEAGVTVALAGLAVLFERPLLLVGAAGVGGWLLARQYAFVRTASAVVEALTVNQSLPRDRVTVGDDVRVILEATLPEQSPVRVRVEATPPVGVETTTDRPYVTLPVGEQSATTAFAAECPLAGEFRFGRPAVTLTDSTGRFRATFSTESEASITVHARQPRNVHVGVGGEPQNAPYGDATNPGTDERGSGHELAEVRPYVPGDSLRHIDWNATARFDRPHVREFEAQTERRLAVLLDCRSSMATGTDGETAFDYVRQVALEIAGYAREQGEPIDVFAVGEAGLHSHLSADGAETAYARVERGLRALETSGGEPSEPAAPNQPKNAELYRTSTRQGSPAVARQRASVLRQDDSPFGTRLRPFFEAADPYVERIEGEPLYGVARSHLGRLSGAVTTVVLTDDERRAETREAVRAARRRNDAAMALLTPTALFETDGLADLETAYDRYADFERFRQELVRIDRVSAFEVAPGDRLSALLAATTRRRTGGNA